MNLLQYCFLPFFFFCILAILFFKINLFILLYNIVLVLPYNDLNPPWVYMCFCLMFCFFGHEACGILAPWPGIKPAAPELEGKVLTPGLPGKSLGDLFCITYLVFKHIFIVSKSWETDMLPQALLLFPVCIENEFDFARHVICHPRQKSQSSNTSGR